MPTPHQDPLFTNGPALRHRRRVRPESDVAAQRAWLFHGTVGRKIEASQREPGLEPAARVSWCQCFRAYRHRYCSRRPVDSAVLVAAEKTPALSEESNDNELPGSAHFDQSIRLPRPRGAGNRSVVSRRHPLPTINSSAAYAHQIRVGVNPDGLVFYALLDRPSGDDEPWTPRPWTSRGSFASKRNTSTPRPR
jgi:hypothetical protein